MGLSHDLALGTFLDSVTKMVLRRKDILENKAQISSFIKSYNREHLESKISESYFDNIENWPPTGATLEKLAAVGNCAQFEMPIPLNVSYLANVSYAGLQTKVMRYLYTRQVGGKQDGQHYERQPTDLTFQELLNICASAQFAAFFHLQQKVELVL